MDWNFTTGLVLEHLKLVALCFWLGLGLRGLWTGLRLARENLMAHRRLRRIGEHRAYSD
jgi:hypothetical protein